ncbi:MAG: o-succinylbenzoate synthase [Desertimonas sp.]
MRLQALELIRIAMPLVRPFRTSFGTETTRDILVVRAITDAGDGWGECVAMSTPRYSPEYVDGAEHVIEHFFAPVLFALDGLDAAGVAGHLAGFEGHPMAKAVLEMAVLDAELRSMGESLAHRLGAVHDRVPAGVSIGITDDIGTLLSQVDGYLADGYRRLKLKIEPGLDVERVAAVRAHVGPDVKIQVDANAAYTVADADHLARLDEFDLLLIEQPLPTEDIAGHAEIARRCRTPICLDESITSAAVAADAIDRGATSVINIKAGRVGGYLESVRVHDVCAERGVPVWCGGMLETGLGRAANLALAALPNFRLPGDTSASSRYWATDLTEPFELDDDGCIAVPTGAGLGVEPLPEVLGAVTTARRRIG